MGASNVVAQAGRDTASSAKTAGEEVVKDVRSGQDGLGSVVKVVSKRNAYADHFFHCCNGVGFAYADRHRIPIMAAAVALGMGIFASAFCGALGLGPDHMEDLPWAQYNDVPLTLGSLVWWACGDESFTGGSDQTCLSRQLHSNNTALWSALAPLCTTAGATASVCAAEDLSCRCEAWLSSTNGTAAIARCNWHLNQWGMCLFPSEGSEWITAALDSNNQGLTRVGSGRCLRWARLESALSDSAALHACASGAAIDSFSLIMGTFGGFMKILEPISRMRRSTDNHQKTIILIIAVVTNIPSLLGIISFNSGCVRRMSRDYEGIHGDKAVLGLGATLFAVSIGLIAPVVTLHVLVPSGVTTARAHVEPA